MSYHIGSAYSFPPHKHHHKEEEGADSSEVGAAVEHYRGEHASIAPFFLGQ